MISPLLRLTRWFQARAIPLEPEQTGIEEGLRAATVVVSLVLLSRFVAYPLLTWSAFGAFWVCLADPGGFARQRLKVMGGFALLGAVMAMLSSYIGWLGGPMVTPLLMLLVFLCGLLRVLGLAAAQAGVLASVVAVVAVDYPGPPQHAAILAAIFLGGCAWALLVCLALWRIHPHQPARRAITAIYRDLGVMCGDLAEMCRDAAAVTRLSAIDETSHRRAVRGSIERARAMLDRLAPSRREGVSQRNLTAAVETGDRLLAVLIALEHSLKRDPEAARRESLVVILRDLSWALTEAGAQFLKLRPEPTGLEAAASLLSSHGQGGHPFDRRMAALLAETFATLADRWRQAPVAEMAVADPVLGGNLSILPILPHAARVAVTVGVVNLITTYFHLPFGYWATMAVVVVMQPNVGGTWPRMVERALGSVAGGALAALLMVLLPTPGQQLLVIFPLAAATIAFRAVNYTLFVVFLTSLFVMVIDLGAPGRGDAIATARVFNNVLGSVFSFIGCLLLWRDPEPAPFAAQLTAAVEANLDYAVLALRQSASADEIDAARKKAGVCSSAAEVALQRLALEGRRRAARHGHSAALLASLRRLAGAVTTAWLGGEDEGGADAAACCESLRATLPPLLQDGTGAPLAVPSNLIDGPVRNAITQIVEEANFYAA